jgi:hypothetical protein
MKRVSFFLLFACLFSTAMSAQQAAVVFSALDNSIDFKTAKAGDTVALHTTRDLVDNGKLLLPRGTALTAKILAADAHSISLALDTATLKTGKTVPLVGIIAAVAFQESRDLAGDPIRRLAGRHWNRGPATDMGARQAARNDRLHHEEEEFQNCEGLGDALANGAARDLGLKMTLEYRAASRI